MSYKADFHVHSYYSDGIMKPTELVRMYKDKEYDVIALTDHDGVDGVPEALIAGEALKIQVIPGVEIGCGYDFGQERLELHILGYYIDIENGELKEYLKKLKENREDRNRRLLKYLQELGYDLTAADLVERPGQTYIGKPTFARAMKKKGIAPDNMWEIFDQTEKEKRSVFETIDIIRKAGGIAVLAHPMKIKKLKNEGEACFWQNLEKIVVDLKKHGLKGMECYHPSASHDEALKLVVLAGKYHLHITEGSDFHGDEEQLK